LSHYGFIRLIEQCWDPEATTRPTASKALIKLHKILPQQVLAKQEVMDGADRIKLKVRGEEFIARRSTLARVRRSYLWELFAGGRENDPPANLEGFIELDADPEQFEQMLGLLKLLEVSPEALASFSETVQKYAMA
jgi:hypothetical protein